MSALTGEGVDAWLEFVAEQGPSGQNIVEVDYDTYAAGEAALGWLNASVALHACGILDWWAFAKDLLEDIRGRSAALGTEIAHVKLIIGRVGESLTGNVTGNDTPAFVRGQIDPAAGEAMMRINARVRVAPEVLQAMVEGAVRKAAGGRLDATITALSSLRPGRPVPTHRFAGK